jgi:hypothetical protein
LQRLRHQAWVINAAYRVKFLSSFRISAAYPYQEFSEGVRMMKLLKQIGIAWVGMTGVRMSYKHDMLPLSPSRQALESLSNGIMRDARVFHIDDGEWISKYNNQGQLCHDSYTQSIL